MAKSAAKKFGAADAKVYTDYKELLKDETIDVVHVCTPNRSHSFITWMLWKRASTLCAKSCPSVIKTVFMTSLCI